jgi:beta-lactamase regulating signal transducer with metallopeptidase domain
MNIEDSHGQDAYVEIVQLPTGPVMNAEPLEKATVAAPIPLKERLVSTLAPALPYLVLGWLVGVFGLSAWHLGGWAQLQRLKRRMVRPVADAVQTRLTILAERLGIHRAVGLLESALVDVPTVVGWIKPVILLPASALTGLSAEQLEAILAHELAHIRRYDYLVNILQTVVEILGFYHPALWWVSHRIRIERENCCDDLAVQICGDSVRYARALTHLEEMRHSRTQLAVAADGGSLISRIARLLGHPVNDDRRFAWLPGLIALLLVGGLIIPFVYSVPARARPELAEGASKETPDNIPTNETEPNDGDTAKSPTGEPQIKLEFIVAEVFADRTVDSNTAAKMVNHMYREIPGPASIDGRSRSFMTRKATLQEVSQPLGEVFTTCNASAGDGEAVLNLLLSGGYADVTLRPAIVVNDGQTATVGVDPKASQQTGVLNFKLTVTARIEQSMGDSIGLEGTFNTALPSTGTTGEDSGIRLIRIPATGEFTLLHSAGLTSRVDPQGRKRLPLLLVKPTIVNVPKGETQIVQDATARITTEVKNVQPVRGNVGGQVQFAFLMADLYGDKVLDDDTASQISVMLYYRPSRGNSERIEPDPKNLRQPLRQILWSQFDVEQPEALVALLESRGYASMHRVPALSAAFDQPISISIADLPRSKEPNQVSGKKPWCTFNVSANGRMVSPESNSIRLQGELDVRQPDGTRAGIPSPAGLALRPATVDKYVLWPLLSDRTDKDGRVRRFLLFVKPTVISRPSGGGGRGGSPVMGGIAPGRGVPTPVSPSRLARIEFTLAELFADRVVDAETAGQIANLLYRRPPESRVRPNPDELRRPLDEVLANCPPEPNQVKALIDVLTARGFCQILTPPSLISMEERRVFVRRFGDSREPDDPNADNANGLAFGAVILPNINDSNQTVSLHMQFLQPLVLSRDPNGAPPVNRAAATLPNGVYRTVRANFAVHTDRDGNRRRPYLLAKATFGGPVENTLPEQGTQPAAAPARDANDSSGQVLSKFTIVKVRPEKKVDQQTARELSRILDKPLDSVEGTSVRQVLQMAAGASADQFAAVGKLLSSSGDIEILTRPALLGQLGKRAEVNIEGDPNSAEPGETITGWKVGVLGNEMQDKYAVRLAVDLDLRLTKVAPPQPGSTGDANDLLRSIRSTHNSLVLEVPDGKCAVQALSGITQGPPTDPNGEAFYLIASVVVHKETQSKTETQSPGSEGEDGLFTRVYSLEGDPSAKLVDAQALRQKLLKEVEPQSWKEAGGKGQVIFYPEIAPRKMAVHQIPEIHQKIEEFLARNLYSSNKATGPATRIETSSPSAQDANDRILTQFIIAKGRRESKIDHKTAIDLADTLGTPAESIEGIQTALLLQMKSNTISADRFMAMLGRLDSGGYIEVLTQPRVLTNPGQSAQIHVGASMSDLRTAFNSLDLGVTARRLDRRMIELALDIHMWLGPGMPTNPTAPSPPIQNIQTRVTASTAEGRYAILALGGPEQAAPSDPNGAVLYLMASPTTIKDTSRSKEELEGRVPTVQISLRLMSVSESFLKNLQQGRLTDKTLSAEQVKTLQQIGERIARQERVVLDETQVHLLVRSEQQTASGRTLTAPRATVCIGEPVDFSLGEPVPYVAGYDEPSSGSGQPSPRTESVRAGVRFLMTTRPMPDNQIAVDANLTSTGVEGFQEKTYKGKLTYKIPQIYRVEVPIKNMLIPDGRTALIVGPKAKVVTSASDSLKDQEAQPLLILITVARTDDSAYPPMRRQMGGLPLSRASQQNPNPDSTPEELSRRIAALEAELIEMGRTLAPQHPEVVRQRAALETCKQELAQRQQNQQAAVRTDLIIVSVLADKELSRDAAMRVAAVLKSDMVGASAEDPAMSMLSDPVKT